MVCERSLKENHDGDGKQEGTDLLSTTIALPVRFKAHTEQKPVRNG